MPRTPLKSVRKLQALSSAKKALNGAKRAIENAEAVVDAEIEVFQNPNGKFARTHHPNTKPKRSGSPDIEDKENSSPISRQLKPSGAVKLKPPTSQANFTRAIKQINYNGGKTSSKKACKDNYKGSTAMPSTGSNAGGLLEPLLEKVKLGKEANTEEDILFEVNATPFCLYSPGEEQGTFRGYDWIKSDSGPLKLYRHRKSGRTRLIQRNRAGIVKMNMAIKNGIYCLQKVHTMQKKRWIKKIEVQVIQFCAINEATGDGTEVESFMIKVNPKNLDALYERLKELGAKESPSLF